MKARGVVVTGHLLEGGGLRLGPSDADLRRFITYWDLINIPIVNGISWGNSELEKTGVVIRSKVTMPQPSLEKPTEGGSINGLSHPDWIDFQRLACVEVVKYLNEHSDIHWGYGQAGGELILPAYISEPKIDAISVGLYDCLPVPSEDTPIEKILDFKAKRQAELASLRIAMDEIQDELIKAEDTSRAFAKAKDKLTVSINDINKVMHEEKWKKRFSSLETFINLPSAAGVALLVGSLTGSIEIGGLAGLGASAVLSLTKKMVPQAYTLNKTVKDFAYIHSIGSELK